ncbi:P-loop NTPase family protein, partial [Streptomyces sparsus]
MVLGSPGSGKTTFCHALAAAGGPPLYHLDDLYWRQGWRRPSPDEWSATVEAVTALPRWIVDGNFLDTVPVRVRAADLVVLLDRHPALCAWALLRRSLRLRRDASGGRQRRDHTPAGLTAADPPVRSVTALLRKALFFRRRELRAMAPLLAGCQARVVRCRTRSRTDRLLRQLTADPAPA